MLHRRISLRRRMLPSRLGLLLERLLRNSRLNLLRGRLLLSRLYLLRDHLLYARLSLLRDDLLHRRRRGVLWLGLPLYSRLFLRRWRLSADLGGRATERC